MKLRKNNSIYVQICDLEYLNILPSFIINELPKNLPAPDKFVKFTTPQAILYFENIQEILNYNEINSLTKEEIEVSIAELKSRQKHLASLWIKEHSFQNIKHSEIEIFNQKILALKHQIDCLTTFLNHKYTNQNDQRLIRTA